MCGLKLKKAISFQTYETLIFFFRKKTSFTANGITKSIFKLILGTTNILRNPFLEAQSIVKNRID